MHVIDSTNTPIIVTDLDKAIEQAEAYKDMQHNPPTEGDKERQEYWTDLYNKLIALKNKQQ